MEPLKPEVRQAVLDANPLAQPGDIDEYEQLLSIRFASDPDAPAPAPAPDEEAAARDVDAPPAAPDYRGDIERRLTELHTKLFPAAARRR